MLKWLECSLEILKGKPKTIGHFLWVWFNIFPQGLIREMAGIFIANFVSIKKKQTNFKVLNVHPNKPSTGIFSLFRAN